MSDIDFNAQIVEEFRANSGKVGGGFEGMNLLVLHTTGARSGKERLNPLVYQDLGEAVAVFASNGGADTNPAWYRNIAANPEATIEIGTATRDVRARIAESEERDRIWEQQKVEVPGFADYEVRTDRVIPVIVLDPA